MQYCSKCGAEIKLGTKFCAKCGKEIATVKTEGSRQTENVKEKTGERNRSRMPVIAALLVLFAVGIAISVVVVLPKVTEHDDRISQVMTEAESDNYNNNDRNSVKNKDISEEKNTNNSSEDSENKQQRNNEDLEKEKDEDKQNYILPDSDKKNYNMNDLEKLSAEEARLARNELYARKGRKFRDEKIQEYFEKQSWYQGTIEPDQFDDSVMFNSYEIYNRNLILRYEKKLDSSSKKTKVSINKKQIKNVIASSELSEKGMIHNAERICDGNLKKAWVEGVAGQGIGETITFNLKKSCVVKGFRINAGYQKTEELYYKNSRPKTIDIHFSTGKTFQFDLDDYYGTQNFKFDSPIMAKSITITIVSVYEGNLYEDTVFSELQWY